MAASSERSDSQRVAVSLLDADDPDEVDEILEDDFFSNEKWKPLGQQANNYGVVENQASAPMPAIVELVVNSYDAILMKNFHQYAGTSDPNPETDDLPEFEGQYDARSELLSDPDNERVEIRADGYKPTERDLINFTVIDNGCGQPPEAFEDTFLGLLDPGKFKQDYPFLQGQYGMGSSGVLQFCGGKSYKFICSASHADEAEWSWSIIRQNREENRYDYLTIDGDVPRFSGTMEDQSYGTFIKVYDYELGVGKTVITGDERFQKRLERYLVDPPLPLRLTDERYPSAKVTETETPGLLGRIGDHDHLVEEDYEIKYNFDHEQLGVRDIRIITFKDKDKIEELEESGDVTTRNKKRFVGGDEHREMAILYTVNGQTHGNEGRSFLTNRCDKPRVGKDTLAFVDFSDIAGTEMVDLFQPTRDRVKRKEIGNTLRTGVEEALKEDDWLNAEEARRRQKLASEDTDEILDESLQSIIEEDPDLQRFFESGEKATTDRPSEEPRPYNPPEVPDTFEILREYDPDGNHTFYDEEEEGVYTVEVPVNRTRRVRFFLNAPNEYLSDEGKGELRVNPTQDALQYANLNRGVLAIGVKTPDMYQEGDVITLILSVTRPTEGPLQQRLNVEFVAEKEGGTSGGRSKESTGSQGLALPNVERVRKEDWDRHEPPFDEQDLVRLAVAGDSVSDMDIYVNIHSAPLRRFIDYHDLRKSSKEFVEERYVMAVALYSVAMYIEYEEQFEEEEFTDFHSPEGMVASSMKGLGQVLLHSIAPQELLSRY